MDNTLLIFSLFLMGLLIIAGFRLWGALGGLRKFLSEHLPGLSVRLDVRDLKSMLDETIGRSPGNPPA